MKQTQVFLYHSAAYTVIISMLFFIFARLLGINELSITFIRYLTIFAFSLIISAAEYIFSAERIPKYLRFIIHYIILCVSFVVIFLSVQNSSGDYQFKASSVFAAIVLFSIAYLAVTLVILLIRGKCIKKNKAQDTSVDNSNTKESVYKSRFGN